MSRVIRFVIGVALCGWNASAADGVPEKKLFAVGVQALKPVGQEEKAVSGKVAVTVPKGGREGSASKLTGENTDDTTELALDSPATREISVEARAQQIESMNGTRLLRTMPRASPSGAARGAGRALDLLLPRGKALLSKNPNARRDPLRILEE
jgi:hypothetical protein